MQSAVISLDGQEARAAAPSTVHPVNLNRLAGGLGHRLKVHGSMTLVVVLNYNLQAHSLLIRAAASTTCTQLPSM